MDTLSIDIETFSSIDLSTAGVFRYVESPDFTILLFGYKFNDDQTKVIDLASGESLPPEVLTMLLSPKVLKTAFNASFEITCINKWLKINHPDKSLDISQWEDTMFRAAYAGYLGGLANVSKALGFTQDKQKDKSGSTLIKKFSYPKTPRGIDTRIRLYPSDDPFNWEQFKKYNAQDVEVEYAIRKELKYIQIPEKEQKAWELDYRIQASGILIDKQLVNAALKLDETEKTRLKTKMRELSGIDNPRSTAQIKNWIVAQGFKSEVNSIRKETVPALIEEAENTGFDSIAELLRLRQELMKSSLAKYSRINEMICEDSRVRGMIQFYGSHTGRWAGRGVQVQNLPRNSIENISEVRDLFKKEFFKPLSLIYSISLSDIASQLLRTVFIPSPGKIFAVADYSAIEARVIAWLSKEEWRLDVFKTSGKIYEASAAQMFGVDFEKICDKDAPEHKLRAQGKVAELALGYQGAVGAIARMDYTGAIPENKRARIVKQWREKSPNIVKFWKDTEEAATRVLTTKRNCRCGRLTFRYEPAHSALTIRLPSGREIFYPNASLNSKSTFSFDNNREKHRTDMYGGRIVENIVQAVARDCLSEAMLRLSKNGYDIKFHVHDEVIIEVDQKEALEEIIEIMCSPPEWALDLPLNAEGFTAEFYQKE